MPKWYYVYILQLANGRYYVGCTSNLKERFARHNKGYVPSAKNLRPATRLWSCAFPDRYKAHAFEKYLKSGSGRALAVKHYK